MKCITQIACVAFSFALVIANEAPVFKGKTLITAREDTKIGTIIGSLSVVDPDGPEDISLNISDKATADLVKLGPQKLTHHDHGVTADIILNAILDSDFHSTIRKLHFEAFDGEKTTPFTVTLQIHDINDNAPQFTQTEYSAKVKADISLGTIVLIATAIDPDPTYGGVVRYNIQTDDLFAYQAFEVNTFTGMLTVKAPLVIKRGTDMHLQIVATDGGGLSTAANVTVAVL